MADRSGVLEDARQLLIQSGAGFLRNVFWEAGVTCKVCAGIPNPGFDLCLACSDRRLRVDLADRLGFVTYAWQPDQTGQVMYGYKDARPASANVRLMQLMVSYAVVAHWQCTADGSLGTPTHWAVVPSLKNRGRAHPLRGLAEPVLRNLTEIAVTAAPLPITNPRGVLAANFVVPPTDAHHVLVIDDTWARGGHVQSVALALKQAGVRRVTALVMARWLDPAWSTTRSFISDRLDADFEPYVCPFTGERC